MSADLFSFRVHQEFVSTGWEQELYLELTLEDHCRAAAVAAPLLELLRKPLSYQCSPCMRSDEVETSVVCLDRAAY